MTTALPQLLTELADLVGRVEADRFDRPTPCSEYDVAALRQHVLGWLPVFAAALSDPDGATPRPDPAGHAAPSDPAAAAAEVRDSGRRIAAALDGGAADRSVRFLGPAPAPGQMLVSMLTGEIVVHGWDLARATGLPWHPSPEACEAALAGLRPTLTPEYRGAGKSFGDEVPVPDDASALDRLLGFLGRDPNWSPSPAQES